jgi:uncharacterized membrane protein
MKIFSFDGKDWVAQLHHGPTKDNGAIGRRAGWEVVQFDTRPPGTSQRISYRPPGWLSNATIAELIEALREGETIRANWHE